MFETALSQTPALNHVTLFEMVSIVFGSLTQSFPHCIASWLVRSAKPSQSAFLSTLKRVGDSPKKGRHMKPFKSFGDGGGFQMWKCEGDGFTGSLGVNFHISGKVD